MSLVDYELVGKQNLRNALVRREYNKILKEGMKELKEGSVILLETSAENYFEANATSVKFLLDNGFEGVYMSFQRPFKNLSALFAQQDIDMNKLLIIDGATSFSGEVQEKNPRCIDISKDLDVSEIIQIIYTSLKKLESEKKFVFVDSLSTMALYEPLSETARFTETLIRTLKEKDFRKVTLFFNVAEDLAQKRYIENISIYADEFLHLGLCT
ncbi:MAG: hypothetical protein JSW62_05160 [Thermoplasmatales archaeon]|nr:MAG: hypothetical protein JSW62_05160 [Thermoplasmatales archaeon]